MATWDDFEDTTEQSRRPQLTRNTGGTTESVQEDNSSINWTYVWAGTSFLLIVALAVVLTLHFNKRRK